MFWPTVSQRSCRDINLQPLAKSYRLLRTATTLQGFNVKVFEGFLTHSKFSRTKKSQKRQKCSAGRNKRAEEEAAPTVQVFWSRQVNDTMHHFPSIFAEFAQVLTQRLVVKPVLEKIKVRETE